MPLWPVWKRAGNPASAITSYSGYTARSFGKKACMFGWNLKPRTPWSAIRRRACSTPARPRAGSIDANGMSTSALAAATSAISSLGTGARPVCDSASTLNTTQAMLRSR